MVETAISKNQVPIRLPDERWQHIIERHGGLAAQKAFVLETVTAPDRILSGNEGALMAIRAMEPGRVLVVVYKEISPEDGFIVTAFPTRRLNSLDRRQQVWP